MGKPDSQPSATPLMMKHKPLAFPCLRSFAGVLLAGDILAVAVPRYSIFCGGTYSTKMWLVASRPRFLSSTSLCIVPTCPY